MYVATVHKKIYVKFMMKDKMGKLIFFIRLPKKLILKLSCSIRPNHFHTRIFEAHPDLFGVSFFSFPSHSEPQSNIQSWYKSTLNM